MQNVADMIKQQPQPMQGNPDLVRHLQHLVNLASSGQIIGFAGAALGADGVTTHGLHFLPQMPALLQNVMGCMDVVKATLIDIIRAAQQQTQVSKIIKPTRPLG